MKIINISSTNFSKNLRKSSKIKFLIIHYTGMQSKRVSIKRLTSRRHKVSCHYVIDRSGNIIQMVYNNRVAWHAGKSKWKNFINLNESSIGIELINKGHKLGYQFYTNSQINQLVKLCIMLKKKYKIKRSNILGHSDIAPLRKKDPGEKFPWLKLSNKGLGLWHSVKKNDMFGEKFNQKKVKDEFFKNLYKIGYRYFNKNIYSKKYNKLLIRSFQRRFRQNKVNGLLDLECLRISYNLARNSKI